VNKYHDDNNNNNNNKYNNDCINRAFGATGIPARKEPSGLVQKDGKRPDGCTLIPRRGGRHLAWDVTVCTTVAASYVTAPGNQQEPLPNNLLKESL